MVPDDGKRLLSKAALYEEDFPWTIVDGHVYAIGEFVAQHPGGPLIRRAIGEDASELFHTHHTSVRAAVVLARYEIGRLAGAEYLDVPNARPFQDTLNSRVAGLAHRPSLPTAEIIATTMLGLFVAWASLCYIAGWWRLNVALAWFWWRHLDSGLHALTHGDFRISRRWHACLKFVYRVLSHRACDYYSGSLNGIGFSKHLWHHIHTNDALRDPDFATMGGVVWVRRHRSAPWHPFHRWQCLHCLPVMMFMEPCLELLQVAREVLEALGALLEPPCPSSPFIARLVRLMSLSIEVMVGPGYQGVALLWQPWWRVLGVLVLARAIAKLVLFPFSEVQHYMPEHLADADVAGKENEEWAVTQLRRTANLKFELPFLWLLDFLMFHGDSHQIEHHLWPAMSFVHYHHASCIVRETCHEFGVPYHEIGYWEGYKKIWQQICSHAHGDPQLPQDALMKPLLPAVSDATAPAPRRTKRPRSRGIRTRSQDGCERRSDPAAGARRRMTCELPRVQS